MVVAIESDNAGCIISVIGYQNTVCCLSHDLCIRLLLARLAMTQPQFPINRLIPIAIFSFQECIASVVNLLACVDENICLQNG